jgi:hypothetical protein
MRSQIELYKIQHNDALPDMAVAAAGGDNDLTQPTDVDGAVVAVGTANSYGPYIQKIPTNQFNDLDTIREEAGASTAGANSAGWVFNTDTGAFHADDNAAHAGL